MSITRGTYFIQSGFDNTRFVGTGPLTYTWPPPPAPLQVVPNNLKDRFEIAPLEGKEYTIRDRNVDLFIGYDTIERIVRLMPPGSDPQPWSIEAVGSDSYLIQLLGSNEIWTANGEGDPIKLQPKNSTPNQQWRFIPYEV